MIRPLPPAPSRDNPGPFAAQSDALLAALAGFVDDCNALQQSLIFVGTTGQSSTSLSVGSGPKTLTASTGKAWVIGAWVHLVSAGGIGNVMVGQVQAYDVDTGALQVNVGAFAGSGTYSDWLIGLSSPQAPITSALIANGALAAKVGAEGGLLLPGDADAPLKAVPKQQMDAAVASVIAPGALQAFAMSSAPSGWLKANGAAISRTAYAALFAAIGTTYGAGDGSTTFNLPDLRGEFVRGWDDGRGVDSGRALGSSQAGQMPSHNHTIPVSGGAGGGTEIIGNSGQAPATLITGSAGGTSNGSENRPRNVALLYCIKF